MSDGDSKDGFRVAGGSTNPLYGATPERSPGEAKQSPPDPETPTSSSSSSSTLEGKAKQDTSDPLYGAPTSETTSGPAIDAGSNPSEEQDGARARMEASSRDRVRELKAARDNALSGGPSSSSHQASQKIKQGALQPQATVAQASDGSYPGPPAIPLRPSHAPTPYRPSPLPSYLRKLSYVLSILLGTGATIASIWSLFLLPLLHASFSARKALVEQQLERWTGLTASLKEMRQSKMYGMEGAGNKVTVPEGEVGKADNSRADQPEKRPIFEEIPSVISGQDNDEKPDQSTGPAPLVPDLSDVTETMRELASTRSNTSTTRTSLLSTLESYTSSLHRQLWAPRPGHGYSGYGVGLNTLGANLAKEKGRVGFDTGDAKSGTDQTMGVRGEDYDAVRKEIRAIKGILLNRRNFDQLR